MAWCVQCGEQLAPLAERCPTCARPVGESSVGRENDRRVSKSTLAALGVLATVVIALAGVAALVMMLRARPTIGVMSSAGRCLVRVGGEHGGVVIGEADGALLVAARVTPATIVGREIAVERAYRKARGVVLVVGFGAARELALILVPDAASLGARVARVIPSPKVGDFVQGIAFRPPGAGGGHVISFEPMMGTIVHDTRLPPDGRGQGLWSVDGRLVALDVLDEQAGNHVALAADWLLERLVLREVGLAPGGAWTEADLPVPAGATVAVALQEPNAATLAARLGPGGAIVHGHEAWPGEATLLLSAPRPSPLWLSGATKRAGEGAPATATVLVIDRP